MFQGRVLAATRGSESVLATGFPLPLVLRLMTVVSIR